MAGTENSRLALLYTHCKSDSSNAHLKLKIEQDAAYAFIIVAESFIKCRTAVTMLSGKYEFIVDKPKTS